jgi:hypothetical protein
MGYYCTICKVYEQKMHVHRPRKIEDIHLEDSYDSGSGDQVSAD